MKINVKNTQVMYRPISRQKGQRVEEVAEFKYLDSVVTSDGYCEKDGRSAIAMGKKPFIDKKGNCSGKV